MRIILQYIIKFKALSYNTTFMRSSSIFLPILILFVSLFLSPSYCVLIQLRVNLNDTIINSISTHTWNLTYSNSLNRQEFTLNFPTCVVIQPNTFVTFQGSSAHTINSNTSIPSSSINFTLAAPFLGTIYTFAINNVKNCFRTSSTRSFSVFSKTDNLLETFPTMTSVIYTEGTISNCALNFNGFTGDVPSTLHLGFKIKNPVVGSTFIVRVQYPVYFSSSLELTTYNSPTITPNFVAICNISLNGTMLDISTNAAITTTNKTILCTFNLPSGVTITDTDNIILHLININNPVTSTIYATGTDFIITTIDSAGFSYDRSTICTINPVPIAQFGANFSQTDVVNANMYPLSISSDRPIPIRLARNDRILLRYSAGGFTGCTGQILVDKGTGTTLVFNQQPTNINQAKLYLSADSIDVNGTLTIQFDGCSFSMPPSTIPIQFTLVFSGTGATVGSYDDYMQLNSTLLPRYSTLTRSQVSLTLSVATIGDLSTYTFLITTRQPLSQTPSILIDFPNQVTLSTAIPTLSSCNVAINSLGIGSKSCQFQAPNSILISLTYTSTISANNSLQISIPNIQNPSNPSSVSGFNINTYYTSSQMSGLVQVGTNVTASQQYTARRIYPQILNNNNFTVYTPGTLITIVYQVGVDLPANSITKLNFTNVLQSIVYTSSTPTLSINSSTSSVFIFNLPNITAGTTLTFVFSCLTPRMTGIYSVVDITTTSNGLEYEKTDSTVTFEVVQPHANSFSVSPISTQSITGKVTDYTFYFTTTVPHTSPFILEISFPPGTNLINGQSSCLSGCLTTNISDTSSGSLDRIELVIVAPTSGCLTCYTSRVSMIKNQKEMGPTGNFSFRTMTTNTRQLILIGQASTIILLPNILTGIFLASDDYYQSNTNPVHIQINVTNKLDSGDYIIIRFLSNTYRLDSGIGCAEGNCTYTQVDSVTLQVKAIPTATQVIQMSISLQINGLISSPDTLYGQSFPIEIESWSMAGRKIDEGSMYYAVDCGYSAAIINKTCRTCATIASQEVCTSCYTPTYSLFNSTKCTNACGNLSQHQTYPNSGICVPCAAPCFTCLDSINCTKCISGFHLMVGMYRCQSSCNTTNGYYNYSEFGFAYCKACTQLHCKSCPVDRCDACMSSWVLLNGRCQGGCAAGTYNGGGVCTRCDRSCQTCDGPGNSNCFNCSVGYFSLDGVCSNACPTGMVKLLSDTCGCEGDCQTCITTPTKCLTCLNTSKFYYNFLCQSECPLGTYAIGQQCSACTSGCQRCSSTTCIQCLNNFNIFENKCYQNCKDIGPRYTSMVVNGVYRCDQCPDGCTDCNQKYQCTQCISDYNLVEKVCKRACEATNTCNVLVTPDPVIPLPGLITFALWVAIIVGLKLFVNKGIYVPYALLFGGALIQFVLLAASLGSVDVKLKSAGRLLQAQPTTTTLGILAVSMLLNYLMNLVAIWIFCKFIKPLIQPRQVDRISNYVVLAIGVLTNYRFYLLAFSRLFKKPHVEIGAPQKLKNLHIILGVSYLLDIITIVAGFLLALNATQLSILNMLGIDLIVIIFLLWGIFVYVLIRPKPQEYYSETKKYSLQQNHITEEGSINNNQKDFSKAKMHNLTSEKLQVEEYNGDENVDNIPTTQPNVIKIGQNNLEKIQEIQENQNPKTKRRTKKPEITHTSSSNKFFHQPSNQKPSIPQPTSERNKNKQVANESLEVQKSNKRKSHERTRSQKVIQNESKKIKEEVYQFQQSDKKQNEQKEQQKTQIQMKSTKYKPGRSSTMKIEQSGMKKKPTYGTFESEIADSNVDEVDLESIIQTKLVDRSKEKRQQRDTRTEADHTENHQQQYEQISPSWFNIQNQRYDVDDKQQ